MIKIVLVLLAVATVCASVDVCGACEDTHEDCHYCIACCYAGCYAEIGNASVFSAPSMTVSLLEPAPAKALGNLCDQVIEHPPK